MANVKTYSKSKNGNLKLSENFCVKEFACKDGSDTLKIDLDLIPLIQRFRNYVETGVYFNSAYRTPSYNKKVGGATSSYHVKGQALDIPFLNSYKYLTSREKMCAFFNTLGVKGIIIYPTFIHVDTRTTKYHADNNGNYKTFGKVHIPFKQTLKRGSNNVDVGIVQYKLKMLGYDVGNADMIYGGKTELSVRKFQSNNNLKVNGVVEETTWNKLFN
jgi:hypothetical protein